MNGTVGIKPKKQGRTQFGHILGKLIYIIVICIYVQFDRVIEPLLKRQHLVIL